MTAEARIKRDRAVSAHRLSKRYGGQRVVDAIDLNVPPGICFGLLGPNGAGKTTTLRMLLGLIPPDDGELRVLDYVMPEQASRLHARVGVVPQTDNLDPDFTVRENLEVYARYFGHAAAQRAAIGDLLTFAALQDRESTPIFGLSGGMKRRLSLARALVNDPELVVLDEPTTGLDPQARQLIWQRLRNLTRQGRTLLLTTHYMEEAERLCDRLAIIDGGRIITEGSPAALVRQHIEPHVLELRGDAATRHYLPDPLPASCRLEVAGDTLLLYAEEEATLLPMLSQYREHLPDATSLLRRANLEDVFLRLTGRDLRD